MDLWALDEVRFEQHGSACRMWVAPEIKDPVLLHHPTREGIGYFGAVRIRDGKFVYSREVKRFNAETFFTFLKKLRRLSSHAGRRVVLILDNVRCHHARLHRKGGTSAGNALLWSSCRPIARSSTRLNGSGN